MTGSTPLRATFQRLRKAAPYVLALALLAGLAVRAVTPHSHDAGLAHDFACVACRVLVTVLDLPSAPGALLGNAPEVTVVQGLEPQTCSLETRSPSPQSRRGPPSA